MGHAVPLTDQPRARLERRRDFAAGLFDIGGNVREWVHDYYVIHTGGIGAIPVDPLGPGAGGNHVIRGASWRSSSITELRLAFRGEGNHGWHGAIAVGVGDDSRLTPLKDADAGVRRPKVNSDNL